MVGDVPYGDAGAVDGALGVRGGFISTPIPSRPMNGPSRSRRARAMTAFFIVMASRLSAVAGRESTGAAGSRTARHPHRACWSRWLPVGGSSGGQARKIVNATECSEVHGFRRSVTCWCRVPSIVMAVAPRPGLSGPGLFDRLCPLLGHVGFGDGQVLARAVLAQIDPGVTRRQVRKEAMSGSQARLLVPVGSPTSSSTAV